MPQTGSQMLRLLALGLVWLICESTTVCESATGAAVVPKIRKPCLKIENDICKVVCRKRPLPGAGWLCCGRQAFNPEEATCCKDGYTNNTALTEGLSEKVSACCGLKAYDQLNEMCCNSTIIAKPAPNAQCCDNDAYDVDKQLCCGPMKNKTILTRNSSDHRCCGHDQFDSKTECCCPMNESLKIQPIASNCCVKESAPVCGTETYNPFNELCCQSTVVSKPASNAKCCEENAYDVDKQLCCGPMKNKTILTRNSSNHQCCGHDQFDSKTECCCPMNESLKIQPIASNCCVKESGVQQPKPAPQPDCTEPNTGRCGSSCYNPSHFRCCEKHSQWRYPGQCDDTSAVYNPRTHVCWDGFVSEWTSWIEQRLYGLAQRRVLCCNNKTLYKDRENGEECSEISIPCNPAKGIMCCSQFDFSPGQHCCGTEVYQPCTEICCNGHRQTQTENTHCCGGKAYNIKDPQMKCCAGTLHNLTLLSRPGHDAQCCGSVLQTPQNVCCSSEDKEVLYSAKKGFRCCGHLYYNASLWSCCAGKLSPVHKEQMNKESRLLSVNNLNETDLCNEMQIGTMESVSSDSIVFSNVLKIHGSNATVKPLASPYILETPDRCSSPKLIPGNSYFFDQVQVFTDFNHNSVLQSLYFILSKCFHP